MGGGIGGLTGAGLMGMNSSQRFFTEYGQQVVGSGISEIVAGSTDVLLH